MFASWETIFEIAVSGCILKLYFSSPRNSNKREYLHLYKYLITSTIRNGFIPRVADISFYPYSILCIIQIYNPLVISVITRIHFLQYCNLKIEFKSRYLDAQTNMTVSKGARTIYVTFATHNVGSQLLFVEISPLRPFNIKKKNSGHHSACFYTYQLDNLQQSI